MIIFICGALYGDTNTIITNISPDIKERLLEHDIIIEPDYTASNYGESEYKESAFKRAETVFFISSPFSVIINILLINLYENTIMPDEATISDTTRTIYIIGSSVFMSFVFAYEDYIYVMEKSHGRYYNSLSFPIVQVRF